MHPLTCVGVIVGHAAAGAPTPAVGALVVVVGGDGPSMVEFRVGWHRWRQLMVVVVVVAEAIVD